MVNPMFVACISNFIDKYSIFESGIKKEGLFEYLTLINGLRKNGKMLKIFNQFKRLLMTVCKKKKEIIKKIAIYNLRRKKMKIFKKMHHTEKVLM